MPQNDPRDPYADLPWSDAPLDDPYADLPYADEPWEAAPPPEEGEWAGSPGAVPQSSFPVPAALREPQAPATPAPSRFPTPLAALAAVYGYDAFRGDQAAIIDQVVAGGDAVVLMPTGGGKSLCYQVPALVREGTGLVVSPLIALMHDQVDALVDAGVAAAYVNSTLTPAERRQTADDVRSGKVKLLYLSPERLNAGQTLDFLAEANPSFFAIDEAHCISEWGHDFRPDYRMMRILKERFPETAVHCYTATATERVRDDIVRELGLVDPLVLVGSFDRPNLVYRVQRRSDRMKQILSVVDRHPNESGVVYCLRRADVEDVCAALVAAGHEALPYHAGLPDEDRKRNQDAFINDRTKIIVATVAFGMGIDK
ncbi:MAG: RecQ family ATP-dependent DNA helicase, partial [Actinobacteria bacterium]|nr:RecQ family ATP-dependent DNA helicase [Actinomycetota bacterium]